MISPMFATGADIITFKTLDGGSLVVLKFFYTEPKVPNYQPLVQLPPHLPVVTVILPRSIAKQFCKRMIGFMAKQDEHDVTMVCRNCVDYLTEACPVKEEKFNAELDGCSHWKEKQKKEL